MANQNPKLNNQGDFPASGEQSLEQIQREIASLELEAKHLQLEELRITTAEHRARREQKKRENAQRQEQLRLEREGLEALQEKCTHLQGGGGDGSDILDGGGDPSKPCIYVTRMLDGKTFLFQCPHCRMKFLGPPHPNLKKTDPDRYESELEKTNDLLKRAKRNIAGADAAFIKAPTFEFSRDGVNILPERM